MAHEYTHAILRHGINLSRTGESGAIMEALCDYFGSWIAWNEVIGGYTSDWTDGFGSRGGQFARHFGDPTTDWPSPSSGSYGDSYYWSGDRYIQSGVLRHQIVLHDWGGSNNGINVTGTPPTVNDLFVTMNWWLWPTVNDVGARNQWLAENEYYYGSCSPKWISNARAWAAVNVGVVPNCKKSYLKAPRVVVVANDQPSTSAIFNVSPTDGGNPPIVTSYNWDFPLDWNVTYTSPQDHSTFSINSLQDLTSVKVICIVGYADSTFDTLSTIIHFVGEDYEQRTMPRDPQKGNTNQTLGGEIQIFPNPAKNYLNVFLPDQPSRTCDFKMLDVTGREVCNRKLRDKNTVVALPSLPSGIYIVRISGLDLDVVRRVVIE